MQKLNRGGRVNVVFRESDYALKQDLQFELHEELLPAGDEELIIQISVFSARASASSTSIPR